MANQHADAAHAAAEHGGHAASGGMPQLDFSTFPSQIFWLIVAFVALYFILSRVALPRIAGAIEERHDTIEDDLERAAEYKRRAEKAEQHYMAALAEAKKRANDIAAEARAEINKDVEKAMAKANDDIAARTAESEKRIGEIRDRAAEDVKTVAQDVAAQLVEALAPGQVSADAAREAVARRMQG